MTVTSDTRISALPDAPALDGTEYIALAKSGASYRANLVNVRQYTNTKDYVVPETYGAIGDGVHDDGPALTLMRTAMYTNKISRVWFGPRNYYLNTISITDSNTRIPHIRTYDVFNATGVITWQDASSGVVIPHGLNTGDKVSFAGLCPGGLTNRVIYFARKIDASNSTCYDTLAHALAGGATGLIQPTGSLVDTIDLTSNILTFAAPHGLSTGQSVTVVSSGTLPAGLVLNTEYFFRAIDATTGTLHALEANGALYVQQNALDNESIKDITSAGTGTIYVLGINTSMHPTRFLNGESWEMDPRGKIIQSATTSSLLQFLYQSYVYFRGCNFYGSRGDITSVFYNPGGLDLIRATSGTHMLFDACTFVDIDVPIRPRNSTGDRNFRNATEQENYDSHGFKLINSYFHNCSLIDSVPSNTPITPGTSHALIRNNTFDTCGTVKFPGHIGEGEQFVDICDNFFMNCRTNDGGGTIECDSSYNINIDNNKFDKQGSRPISVINNNVAPGRVADGTFDPLTGLWKNICITRNKSKGVNGSITSYGFINVGNGANSSGGTLGGVQQSPLHTLKNVFIEDNEVTDMVSTTGSSPIIGVSGNRCMNIFIQRNKAEGCQAAYGISVTCGDDGSGNVSENIHINGNSITGFTFGTTGTMLNIWPAGSLNMKDIYVKNNRFRGTGNTGGQSMVLYQLTNLYWDNNDFQCEGRLGDPANLANTNFRITNSQFVSTTGTMGGWTIQGAYFSGNTWSAASGADFTITNASSGIYIDRANETYVHSNQAYAQVPVRNFVNQPAGFREERASAIPTAGSYLRGAIVWNTAPSSGGTPGWINTLAAVGTFGTLSSCTATTTSGSPTVTVNSNSGLSVGILITIVGVTGSKTITAISGTTLTVDTNCDASVAGAAVAYVTPIFKAMANLA